MGTGLLGDAAFKKSAGKLYRLVKISDMKLNLHIVPKHNPILVSTSLILAL
jgi:hypothetical protein